MVTRRSLKNTDGVVAIVGTPALLPGESLDEFNRFYRQIRTAIAPRNAVEELWVHDVTHLTWESGRLRQLKAKLMTASRHDGIEQSLTSVGINAYERNDLLRRSAEADAEAVQQIDKILKRAGYDEEKIMAQTLVARLDDVERLDRMIAQMEARRNAALREIDRHREAIRSRLPRAIDAEEAEFEDVPSLAVRS